MWIEPYKAGGRRYYRAVMNGKPIHLGSAMHILRKVRPEKFAEPSAKRTDQAEKPPKNDEGPLDKPPEHADPGAGATYHDEIKDA